MSDYLILPEGYTYTGVQLGKGGQAAVYMVKPPPNAQAGDGGFNSLKADDTVMPESIALRRVFNFDPSPPENESASAKAKRLEELRRHAQEVNISTHFAMGHPFVDVIGFYTGLRNDGTKELYYMMPLYQVTLWKQVEDVRKLEATHGRGAGRYLNENVLRFVMAQLICGLEALHDRKAAHRDVTAANVFLNPSSAGPTVYLADFGFAKPHRSHTGGEDNMAAAQEGEEQEDDGYTSFGGDDAEVADEFGRIPRANLHGPPQSVYLLTNSSRNGPYTSAGTTAYRAPESLLHCNDIDNSKLDIWAAGMNLLYMICREISFFAYGAQGWFNETQQLVRIFQVIAPYDAATWDRLAENREEGLSAQLNRASDSFKKNNIYSHPFFTALSSECIAVIHAMLHPDPKERPTATKLLQSAWFDDCGSESIIEQMRDLSEVQKRIAREGLKDFSTYGEEELRAYLLEKAPVVKDTTE